MKGKRGKTQKRGIFFLSAASLIFFLFYVFTPQRPVQFISLFFILLVLGSKAYSEYLCRHLRLVRRDRELRVFRYQWTDIELWAENSGRLPAFLLVAEDSSGGTSSGIAVFRDIKSLCTLGGRSRQLFRWEAYGSDRGVFSLGPASLRGADPLGLFPFVLVFDESEDSGRLFVYPAPAFAALRTPGGIPLGNLVTPDPFNEDLTRPRSLRDYSPGDESRRINWKASAKLPGPLLVNEYESSLSYPLVLFLNVDPSEYERKNRELYVERVIEAAAALCLMAARERQVLGLILHNAAVNSGATNSPGLNSGAMNAETISPAGFALIPILERLAALKPFEAGVTAVEVNGLRPSTRHLLEKGKTLSFGTRLIYTGPALPEGDYHALEILRRRRLSLEYLIIDEKNLRWTAPDIPGTNASRGNSAPRYQMKERGYEIL